MPDTEKITINMPAVDLGKIDLLVQEGLYSNRTDFIRTAIRSQLDKHSFEIQQSVSRNSFAIGVISYNRQDFEKYKARNEKLKLALVGLLHLQNDITPELASEVVESILLRGMLVASEAVKAALAERIK
jgi:Arc/MetJ-type ribon-helix-helix transcriptional regulator